MLYIFMGPSCSGKSSAAEELKKLVDAEVYSGKDYLRLSGNQNEAWNVFMKKLEEASISKDPGTKSIIYVLTDRNEVTKLSSLQNAVKVRFVADLRTIVSRFTERIGRELPKPMVTMLERQAAEWESANANLCVDTADEGPCEIAKGIYEFALKAI